MLSRSARRETVRIGAYSPAPGALAPTATLDQSPRRDLAPPQAHGERIASRLDAEEVAVLRQAKQDEELRSAL